MLTTQLVSFPLSYKYTFYYSNCKKKFRLKKKNVINKLKLLVSGTFLYIYFTVIFKIIAFKLEHSFCIVLLSNTLLQFFFFYLGYVFSIEIFHTWGEFSGKFELEQNWCQINVLPFDLAENGKLRDNLVFLKI